MSMDTSCFSQIILLHFSPLTTLLFNLSQCGQIHKRITDSAAKNRKNGSQFAITHGKASALLL